MTGSGCDARWIVSFARLQLLNFCELRHFVDLGIDSVVLISHNWQEFIQNLENLSYITLIFQCVRILKTSVVTYRIVVCS